MIFFSSSQSGPKNGDSASDLCTLQKTTNREVDIQCVENLSNITLENVNVDNVDLHMTVGVRNEGNIEKEDLEIKSTNFQFNNDLVFWEINDETRDYIVKNGFVQNMDCDFIKSKRQYDTQARYFSKSLFEKILHNGEKSSRKWLIYSESTGNVYCGPCLAFDGGTQFGTKKGFDGWKNFKRIEQHENSHSHKNCLIDLKTRGSIIGRIDTQILKGLKTEIKYWRNVLQRVVSVIKTLSSRGLSFRGHTEKFGSPQNGNYLMSLELLAEYDPFLAEHNRVMVILAKDIQAIYHLRLAMNSLI